MFRRAFATLIAFSTAALAHDGLDLAPPLREPEAWNVLTLCHDNIQELVRGQQWSEIPIQASLSMQAASFLRDQLGTDEAATALRGKLQYLEECAVFLVRSTMKAKSADAIRGAANYAAALRDAEAGYTAQVVKAPVFSCPMCRGIRELDPMVPCLKCGMQLVPRVIPASSLYNTPGEPSIAITPTRAEPLRTGEASEIRLQFTRRKDGAPITPDDLLVVHTERMHLLIVDSSLRDYHHEHPRPTEIPGEYSFAFTPRASGSYRIFADVVPRLSNVQEYAVCDLPAATSGEALADRVGSIVSEVDGLRYELKWETGGLPVRAKQPVNASITVTTLDGQPFRQLEPIMGTFAHLVAFHEDRATVLHIHPVGVEPQKPEDRGGPRFNFRFYAPKAGFMKLYSQVQVGGRSVFAPFGLIVEP